MRRYGLYAKKVGMTSLFGDKGNVIPVTVLKVLDFEVLKNEEGRMVKFFKGAKKLMNPQTKMLDKVYNLKENSGFIREMEQSDSLGLDHFQDTKFVDISGRTAGKQFSGVMERWNYKGGRASHGASLSHRTMGSTGMRNDPGKTMKGKAMAGRHGYYNRTQQNLKVVKIEKEEGLIFLKGSIPGRKSWIVFVSQAVKKNERKG